MRREICGSCEKEAKVIRGNYRFDEVGLPVLLKHVELVKCEHCGNVDPIIPDLNGLMHVIAFAVISRPCKLGGQEIKFLRKYLGMNGEEFAGILDIDRTTLSKWENGQDIGPQSDRLIRLLVLNKSTELRKHVEEMMRRFSSITDCDHPPKSQLNIDPRTREYEYA
jgi:DNA-binding transcriptional regulator YiaG